MPVVERSATQEVVEARERYVAAGVATPPLVVARAQGARIEDVDGRSYIDFAGGLGCQNAGHGPPAAVAAIHEQVDHYLHQCFMVGMYEPYVEVCRRLAELSPCRGDEQKSLLVNSGAEAVENAVKIARAATGRPAVVVFDRAFHGRTLLTMAMTSKVVPYKRGFGPFAPEVYRAPAPYPYRGVSTDDAINGLEALFKSEIDPEAVACVVLEPVQGEGGFIPMPRDFPPRLREL
ncbi:MAG: aminotransferase class III-fold pyridoxal phosphate-dependent enzyme, partial [Gaiellaceae bacterium]